MIVDEGANSCCHGEMWRENADIKLAKLGFKTWLKDSTPHKFKGVGSKTTTGKYQIPFGMKRASTGISHQGAVSSHEIAGASHPMLLSQGTQAQIGFVKCMRSVKITLLDFGEELEVVRQARTGLFMVRIDHLNPVGFAKFMKAGSD